MPGRRKMAIFTKLNPHISSEGQRPPIKFGASVVPHGLHFRAKARRDRANQFCANRRRTYARAS